MRHSSTKHVQPSDIAMGGYHLQSSHTRAMQPNYKKKRKRNVFSNFMILYWVAFIVILGPMKPVGQGLDTLITAES